MNPEIVKRYKPSVRTIKIIYQTRVQISLAAEGYSTTRRPALKSVFMQINKKKKTNAF
jgi:hypothetical protein